MKKSVSQPIDTPDKLNAKQTKLIEYLLEGKGDCEALELAGYSKGSKAIIQRIRPLFKKMLEEKQQKLVDSISKGDCVNVLKDMIMDANVEKRTRIMAIQTLAKLCGFEAPARSENINLNSTLVTFTEDLPS